MRELVGVQTIKPKCTENKGIYGEHNPTFQNGH